MNNKPNSDKEPQKQGSKESNECCQGGYGYMKRRLGLLSFEADIIKAKKQNGSQE